MERDLAAAQVSQLQAADERRDAETIGQGEDQNGDGSEDRGGGTEPAEHGGDNAERVHTSEQPDRRAQPGAIDQSAVTQEQKDRMALQLNLLSSLKHTRTQ